MKLEITTLIENNPDDKGKLLYEHGLSLFIEADGVNILFDTGQTGDFINNATNLNKDLTTLNYVVISHGHYDHSGGFEKLVDTIKTVPKLIVGADFFNLKYKKIGEQEYKYNGNSFDENYIIHRQIPLKKVEEDIYYLTKNIIVFHNFKRNTDYEKRNDKFYIGNCAGSTANSAVQGSPCVQDEFADEIALGIATENGLVVIVGCSHVGIVNILQTIADRVKLPIYAIIGGTHLIEADENRRQQTIASFKAMNIQYIAVSHCTGEEGIRAIKENFGENFIFNNTGKTLNF